MQETTYPNRIDIGTLQVADTWKKKFRTLEQAGGPKLPHLKTLPFKERFSVTFNFLGFIFGPLYYLAKGMWKKALFLFAACVAAVLLIGSALDMAGLPEVANSLGYGVSAFFGVRLNIDYYKKMVLGENGWW